MSEIQLTSDEPAPVLETVAAVVSAPAVGMTCLNCGVPLMGDYCHECGQDKQVGELTIESLVVEFLQKALSLENGFVRTFVELSTRPGPMIIAYVRGQRRPYVHPVAYLLLAAAMNLIAIKLTGDAYWRGMEADLTPDSSGIPFNQVITSLEHHPAISAMVIALSFVPSLRLVFGRRMRTAEAFVFTTYVFAQLTFLTAVIIPLGLITGNPYRVSSVFSQWSLFIYGFWAAAGYFGTRVTTFLKMGLVFFLGFTGTIFILIFYSLFLWALMQIGSQLS